MLYAGVILVKQDTKHMGRMKKNKVQKSKSIIKEDDKDILLNKIIKTREEILDLLKVLKTF
jgi:hypothetical protein